MKKHRGVSEGPNFQIARELLPNITREAMRDVGARRRLYDALRGCRTLLLSAGPSPATPRERLHEATTQLQKELQRFCARKDWLSEVAGAEYLIAVDRVLRDSRAAGPAPERPAQRRFEAIAELRAAMDGFGGQYAWASDADRAECVRHLEAALLWLRDEGGPSPQEACSYYDMVHPGVRVLLDVPAWVDTATADPIGYMTYNNAGGPLFDDDMFPPAIKNPPASWLLPDR